MAKWFGRRPFSLPPGPPIITFTFDDYPRSAQFVGGKILADAGAAGTYFTSLGLMQQETPTGRIFGAEDLGHLLASGHEVGCHTYHHCPAWETPPEVYRRSLEANQRALAGIAPDRVLATHSYPISYPRPATKRHIGRRFLCARGGGQTGNTGRTDLNYLNSFFLEQSRDDLDRVKRAIAANTDSGGWLIFSTHDVCDNPTRYGCIPQFFKSAVQCATQSGNSILPMAAAIKCLNKSTHALGLKGTP